jgi:hypothetical protein
MGIIHSALRVPTRVVGPGREKERERERESEREREREFWVG